MTALRALEVAGLVLGKRVLVAGANGGVGRFAIQLARESGAHVTVLVRDAAASHELLRRLGAAEVVARLDGQVEREAPHGGSPREHSTPCSSAASAARPCSTSTNRRKPSGRIAHCSPIITRTTPPSAPHLLADRLQ
jgi:D-arabinose 1-dehydrogenase-like Zn-dependent alcohol dehydrogenase